MSLTLRLSVLVDRWPKVGSTGPTTVAGLEQWLNHAALLSKLLNLCRDAGWTLTLESSYGMSESNASSPPPEPSPTSSATVDSTSIVLRECCLKHLPGFLNRLSPASLTGYGSIFTEICPRCQSSYKCTIVSLGNSLEWQITYLHLKDVPKLRYPTTNRK